MLLLRIGQSANNCLEFMHNNNYGSAAIRHNGTSLMTLWDSRPYGGSEYIQFNKKIELSNYISLGSNLKIEILKVVYPIGSIYTSFESTAPATLFGFGTWTQITDRFLYCANSSGTTGGEATHTHQYGIKYLSRGNLIAGYEQGRIQLYGKDGWTNTTQENYTPLGSLLYPYNADNSKGDLFSKIAETTSTSTMPPYITVYCWRRTA